MSNANALDISIASPTRIIYRGKARSVVLPGEKGTFEILFNHKPVLSLLVLGDISIDNRLLSIKRGIVKVALNRITAIVEEAA
jgi:F-type H+-transporting ATPase subunit epsilon